MKRSGTLKTQNGMVMHTQAANRQREAANWWPSKYGPDDEAGALNEISSSKVLEAVGLVQGGRVYDLAHVLHAEIPAFPGRTFRQYLTTNYHQINRRSGHAGPDGLVLQPDFVIFMVGGLAVGSGRFSRGAGGGGATPTIAAGAGRL